jgi:hypothetical protein
MGLLPARVVYYVLANAMFAVCSHEEVMRHVAAGLAWAAAGRQVRGVPSKVAICKARPWLGREPLEWLFGAAACPSGVP